MSSLSELFKASEIKYVEVIDDAFDQQPNIPLSAAQATAFTDSLSADDYATVCAIFETDDFSVIMESLLSIEGTLKLFERIDELSDKTQRAKVFTDFYEDVEPQRELLQPLLDLLEETKVSWKPFGSDYEARDEVPDIVFIDLKISHSTVLDVSKAVSIVRKIQARHPDAIPIIFLMSSLTVALKEKRDEFRRSCDLYASQFEKLNKDMFKRTRELQRMIADYVSAYPAIKSVRGYHAAWENAIQGAANRFQTQLRDLDVADYVALKDISLAHEKSSVGGYLTEVLMEYFLYELQGSPDIHALAGDIDKWAKGNIRSRFNINKAAETVYLSNIIFNPELLKSEESSGLGYKGGKFNLGDVFLYEDPKTKEYIKAAVVMSPACDLARYDYKDKKANHILLCEGDVSKFDGAVPVRNIKTESPVGPLIVDYVGKDGKSKYLINWNAKRPLSWCAEGVANVVAQKTPWCFAARMRMLYAIQLQRAMTNDLSRVGVQVAPSIYEPHGVAVYCRENGGWKILCDEWVNNNSAAAVTDDGPAKKIMFMLRGGVWAQLLNKLDVWVSANEGKHGVADLKKILADESVYSGLQHVIMNRTAPPEKALTYRHPLKNLPLKGDASKTLREVLAFVREQDKFDPEKPVLEEEKAAVVILFKQLSSD
ncbi:hypothetical protein B1219_17710 [Pseudomonas ogarae]|uniref:hypothetical protein n=1 Tax=Pseudomonas ogarae (strain DSM 112162 / CECT 30235 / F113) TaxID=1114970 RepID=UPI0009A3000D|nr:hypothetical protein [Pseudomonas ogarae]OPG72008.1 hypothetical protein B1219_17710 [Pseudomonas ogarae]